MSFVTNIKQKLQQSKKVIILLVLVAIVFLGYLLLKNKKSADIAEVSEGQQVVDTSPLTFFPDPTSGEVPLGGTLIGISLFFDDQIDLSSLNYEVFPPFELIPKVLADYPDRVILTPTRPWQTGIVYRITIKRGVTSVVTGRTTPSDVVLEYEIVEVPEEIENYSPHI